MTLHRGARRGVEGFARSTLDGLSSHVAVLEQDGTIITTNRAWREFAATNDAPSFAGVAEGANYLAVCDGASGEGSGDAAAFAVGIRSVASGLREYFELEYPCHSPSERRWFVGRVTRFPGANPSKLIVAHEDITGRKRAEEERNRVFTLAPEPVCVAGLDGYFKRVNPALEATLGRPAEELVARPFVEFVHPEDRASTLEALSGLVEGEPVLRFENRYVRKDGSTVWLSWNAVPEEDGLIFAAARDVSEQRRAEKELRATARRQRAVADLGHRALTLEPDALMDEAVSAVVETLGVDHCGVLELLAGGDALLLRSGVGWQEGLVGKATVSASRHTQAGYALLSDGPVVVEDLGSETRFLGSPLLHDHGIQSGISAIIRGRDCPFGVLGAHATERGAYTDEDVYFLGAVANVLAASVERGRAEAALSEVREAERGRVARELHDGALQGITYASVTVQLALLNLAEPNVPEHLEKAAATLLRVGRELRETVYDLHPADAGGRRFADVAGELLATTRSMAPELETELLVGTDFPERLPDKMGREIARILQEALNNVRRHAGASRVRVFLDTEGREIRVEIADDGVGFDPAKPAGGLGRTSMRERALALDGTLEVESAPGEETRVRLRIPRPR